MWTAVAGMGLGALAGATSSAGYKGKAFDMATDAKSREKLAAAGTSRLEGWASGEKPMMSQANMNRLLSGQRSRLASSAAAARARATSRENQRGGIGARSGSLDRRLSEIDRSLIDAERQTAAPLYGQLAMAQPEYAMQAQQMGLQFLQGQEGMAQQDWERMEALKAARVAQGSALHRGLAGAAGAMGGMGGMGGLFGGGGGGGGVGMGNGSGSSRFNAAQPIG